MLGKCIRKLWPVPAQQNLPAKPSRLGSGNAQNLHSGGTRFVSRQITGYPGVYRGFIQLLQDNYGIAAYHKTYYNLLLPIPHSQIYLITEIIFPSHSTP